MPLRRLELCNFKSYRGTQVISFGDTPFTCIIGPNGSGKSNLMDAISFVLGVKSAQLRSTQLKDLVYRGRKAKEGMEDLGTDVDMEETQTQTQDTQNDARTAWVMAVYEDDDGKEWSFKRSIAMTGASTYYLNNKAVAWTIYNQQLEKFNILVKAKNFLVFQGDVEGVASQDSKALAKLIDQISGQADSFSRMNVTDVRHSSLDLAPAYIKAKEAQEKATEASTSNYTKKREMMTEAKHFKEQRDEIRQWEELKNQKDAMVQRHFLWRLFHLAEQINRSTQSVEEANANLTQLRTSVTKRDTKLKEAKKSQAKAQLSLRKREAELKKAEKSLEDKVISLFVLVLPLMRKQKPEQVTLEAQIAHSVKKAENAKALSERVRKDEERQSGSLAALREGAEDIQQRMNEAAEKQRKKSQLAGKALSKADLDEYTRLRSAANALAVQERQQLVTLRREQKTLRDGLASVEDKLQQAERQESKLSGEVEILRGREEAMATKVKDMNEERERIKGKLDQAQAERVRISQAETILNERLQETYHQLLQAGVDKRETEREARLKEALASLKRVFPGVHGRVVDLCKPVARKYDAAVMTVLGRNIDAVVVEHEKTAIDCIEYMRNQRAGQATFIPLDTIQVKPVPERLRNFARGTRLAIDCIEYSPAVERAMQHACGSSMVCDTMDDARYVCYEKGQEVKAVTLDGTVIHRSGLITGGQGEGGGRKFDDTHVDNLRKLKETYLQQLQDLSKAKPKDKADDGLLESLSKLDADSTIAKDDLDATRLRLNGLRAELKHVESEIKKFSPDKEKKLKAVASADEKAQGLLDTIDAADSGIFDAFCKKINVATIREYEDVQLKIAKEESEAMEAFASSQARIKHQIEFESSQLATTRERLASLESTVAKEKRNEDKLRQSQKDLLAEIGGAQDEIKALQSRLSDSQTTYEEATRKVEETRDAARRKQRELDSALKEIAGWNDEIEKSASDRHAIYRKCRLEEIDLPLLKGSLDKVPIEEKIKDKDEDGDIAMDVDDDGTQRPKETDDFGVEVDFEDLEDDDKENGDEAVGKEFEAQIAKLRADVERVVPNMKAIDRLKDIQQNLDETEKEADQTRKETKRAKDEFQDLKKKRCDLFNKAYNHMSACIDKIYKDLTKSSSFPQGGVAFLSLEDAEEPYLSGVKYNTMPPGKRFVEIEQLSGGEKTMAALALLFAIHSFHPAPFFVLDEVDSALDPTNVAKLARFVREQAEKDVQFLIISLKSTLYEHADGLVGVYREQEENSSRTLTLDLRKVSPHSVDNERF
ncbi:structural maintenance of chromosome 1, partial [Tremellales sp. Uapishka_1]